MFKKIVSSLLFISSVLLLTIPLVYMIYLLIDLKFYQSALPPEYITDKLLDKQFSTALLLSLYFLFLLPIWFIPITYILLFIAYLISKGDRVSNGLKKICQVMSIIIISELLVLLSLDILKGGNPNDGIPSIFVREELLIILLYTFPLWIAFIISVIFLSRIKRN